jgi:hypothetical protein
MRYDVAPWAGARTKRLVQHATGEGHMAKKKGAKKKKTGKARAKKLSVKKRPVKDLDARKAKSAKGGVSSLTADKTVKLGSAAVKFGTLPTVSDTYQKIG